MIPECKKPITMRIAVLSWEPHVLSSGQVRGIQFFGCVQQNTSVEFGIVCEEDGFKATFDGERYMFGTNEKPMQFVQEVSVGSLLRFTVWGMKPSDMNEISYGSVIVVDGVNCTTRGSNIYFNATLVVSVEPVKINFVDSLPNASYSTDDAVLSKIQLKPYYMQGCADHSNNMPPFYFEDVVMKVKADQPYFKPYIEFSLTMVEGDLRIAIGATVKPALCKEFVAINGLQGIMEDIAPCPEEWNFTLVGHLTSYVAGSKQCVFITSGFFY